MNAPKLVLCCAVLGLAAFFLWRHRRTDLNWVTSQHTYEDFPLFLRRPTKVDTPANRKRYPTLAIITHEFTKRYPDGRPEPDYNETLFGFDNEIVSSFDSRRLGVPVLVETFGGKRHYYFYLAPSADVTAIIQPISHRYPNEKLTWETRPDTNWGFLDRYAKDFF